MENLILGKIFFFIDNDKEGFFQERGWEKNKEVVFGIYMYCYKLKFGMISLGKVRL